MSERLHFIVPDCTVFCAWAIKCLCMCLSRTYSQHHGGPTRYDFFKCLGDAKGSNQRISYNTSSSNKYKKSREGQRRIDAGREF